MITVDIQGFGLLELEHFVTDFSGTLSEDGKIFPGVKATLNELADKMKVHVLNLIHSAGLKKRSKGLIAFFLCLEVKNICFRKKNMS